MSETPPPEATAPEPIAGEASADEPLGPEILEPGAARKKGILGLFAAVVIGGAAIGIAQYAGNQGDYVARVDGQPIPAAEFKAGFEQTRSQYATQYGIDFATDRGRQVEADIRKNIVSQLIERQIIRNEAKARGLVPTKEDIDKKFDEVKAGYPTDEEFLQAIKKAKQEVADVRRNISEGQIVERVVGDVTKAVEVPEDAVRTYYDGHKKLYEHAAEMQASHILVSDEPLAHAIMAQLRAGAKFEDLARRHSTDPGSKEKGGDLGYFGKGTMLPEFEKAAASGKPGTLVGPIKTTYGYHIIRPGPRNGPRTSTLDEVRKDITAILLKEKQREVFAAWLKDKKATAKLAYAKGFEPTPDAAHGDTPGAEPTHAH